MILDLSVHDWDYQAISDSGDPLWWSIGAVITAVAFVWFCVVKSSK